MAAPSPPGAAAAAGDLTAASWWTGCPRNAALVSSSPRPCREATQDQVSTRWVLADVSVVQDISLHILPLTCLDGRLWSNLLTLGRRRRYALRGPRSNSVKAT